MKTFKNLIQRGAQHHFSIGILIIPVLYIFVTLFLYSCMGPYMVGHNPDMVNVSPPDWAAEYDNENPVNYYYLPDIECYYDLRSRDFVYMEDGTWRFSALLPSIYASFDLANCFVVKLNNSVHEPWMHFQYYVAHYPRYYYKSVDHERYGDNGRHNRWFNENVKHSGFNNQPNTDFGKRNENRQGSGFGNRQNNNVGNRGNSESGNRSENRLGARQQQNQNNSGVNSQSQNNGGNRNEVIQNPQPSKNVSQHNEGATRQTQPMKYYGRQIGQPVKVQKNMRKPQEKTGDEKSRKKSD